MPALRKMREENLKFKSVAQESPCANKATLNLGQSQLELAIKFLEDFAGRLETAGRDLGGISWRECRLITMLSLGSSGFYLSFSLPKFGSQYPLDC